MRGATMKLPIERWLIEEGPTHKDEYVRGAAKEYCRQHGARFDMVMARWQLAAARVRMHYDAYLERP
jgi:hypothetical protein